MTREDIVKEALSWRGTPYLRGGRIKGVGCDCATFILEVFRAVGHVTPDDDSGGGFFSDDWWANTEDEAYMKRVLRHGSELVKQKTYAALKIEPGCIVLLRAARSHVYNHGAIVVAWPRVIHAIAPEVVEIDASRDPMWQGKEVVPFDPMKGN